MIKLTRKGLFEKGWSISYKGKHDVLKTGSWAPTLVYFLPISAIVFVDRISAERLLH